MLPPVTNKINNKLTIINGTADTFLHKYRINVIFINIYTSLCK